MNKKVLYIVSFLVVVICVLLFFVTRFSDTTLMAQDGYFVSGSKVDSVLMSSSKNVKNADIDLEKMDNDDQILSNLGKYYITKDDKKKEINTDYPLYTNNGLAIVNYNENNTLINKNFETFTSYENFTITDGKMYNYADSTQADVEDYIFLEIENGMDINLVPLTIQTRTKEIIIPVNSIINFQEGSFRYYVYQKKGELALKKISSIRLEDKISLLDMEMTYEDLLIGLRRRSGQSSFIESIPEEYVIEDENTDNNTTYVNDSKEEKEYQQPKVSADEFKSSIYMATSSVKISDPAGVITGGVNFTFMIGDKTFLRKTFVSSGTIQVNGLKPNTEYTVVGTFRYYNEEKKKVEVEFLRQNIKTGDYKTLEPISLSFHNGPIFSDHIQIDELKITSDINSEAIIGLGKAYINVNKDSFGISTALMKQLTKGEAITYESPATLKSNTKVDYSFVLYDSWGNKLNVTDNKGNTRTSKIKPTVTFADDIKKDVRYVTFNYTLKNQDHVNIANFRYVVYDNANIVVGEGKLDPDKEQDTFTVRNLDPNHVHVIKIMGSLDVEDGNGTVDNFVLGQMKFTTLPITGTIRVTDSVPELTYDGATLNFNIDKSNTTEVLLELLTDFQVDLIDPDGDIIHSENYKNQLEDLRLGKPFSIDYTDLDSVTEYTVNFTAKVTQGRVTQNVTVVPLLKTFKTYKLPARVDLKSILLNGSMLDFDIAVLDPDGSIDSDRVILELRDTNNSLIDYEYLGINEEYVQKSYTQLRPNSDYHMKVVAESYNERNDKTGHKQNKSIEGYEEDYYDIDTEEFLFITSEDSLYGSIELSSIERQITGKNLFDIYDFERIRKYVPNTTTVPHKRYNLKQNAFMIGVNSGWVNFSYYVPEAVGHMVTFSFSAKYDKATTDNGTVIVMNDFDNSPGTNWSYTFKSGDLKRDVINDSGETVDGYKVFTFRFFVENPYIGFYISSTPRSDVWFKDINIVADVHLENEAANDASYSNYPERRYIFTDPDMKSGNDVVPLANNNTKALFDAAGRTDSIGNLGNGYARITFMSSGEVVKEFQYDQKTIQSGQEGQKWKPTVAGEYKIELWGASGGDGYRNADIDNISKTSHGGRGAYTSGILSLSTDQTLYFYIGGSGEYGGTNTENNGGGAAKTSTGSSGGGATDVRVADSQGDPSLNTRIMVAAGGGGADDIAADDGSGGAGGALASEGAYINGVLYAKYRATQTYSGTLELNQGFGKGANATTSDAGGGGGGWFGGTSTNVGNGGGAGGSSYISGYKGCVSRDAITNREDDGKYTKFTSKSTFLGSFKVNVKDPKHEVKEDKYYISLYKNGIEVEGSPFKYDLTNLEVVDAIKTFDLDKNQDYRIVLSVKMYDRFYELSSYSFNTMFEIHTISTIDDFYDIFPNGHYAVINDLDFNVADNKSVSEFYGEMDFQGHTVHVYWANRSYLFNTLKSGSTVKNIVIDLHMNATAAKTGATSLAYTNNGTIENVMVNITGCTEFYHYNDSALVYANYGTIKNFVINNQSVFYGWYGLGLVCRSDYGFITNGFIYGEDIDLQRDKFEQWPNRDTGAISAYAGSNARITNVISNVNIRNLPHSDVAADNYIGNLIGYTDDVHMHNCFSVEKDDYEYNYLEDDPNVGRIGALDFQRVYYFSHRTYKSTKSAKGSYISLHDIHFMNKLINGTNGFIIDELVSVGFYPQVQMDSCMPKQEMIELPRIVDGQEIDVLSSEEKENYGDSADVLLQLNNPAANTITGVTIQNINNVDILSQETYNGRTDLLIHISNPSVYKSKYNILSVASTDTLEIPQEVTFTEGSRYIEVSLYNTISTLDEWLTIKSKPSENFRLTQDLDFKDVNADNYIIDKTITGTIDGGGHKLKNITIKDKQYFIYEFSGTGILRNLVVENFAKELTTNVNLNGNNSNNAFIYHVVRSGTYPTIDNVHMQHVDISTKGGTIGGMIRLAEGVIIQNSSITDFEIGGEDSAIESEPFDIIIGGLVGSVTAYSVIQNTFAQDINIDATAVFSSAGIGGLIGTISSGNVTNVYATGNINAIGRWVGGIAGTSAAVTSNVWSAVNVTSKYDYVGGIYGKQTNENISSTLTLGYVYNSYDGDNVNLTTGNTLLIPQKNYFWEQQQYNGYVGQQATGEKLLTSEQLSKKDTYYQLLDFKENFDYTDVEKGRLPKLINTNTGKVIDYQNDFYLPVEKFNIAQDVEIIHKGDHADLYFRFENPENYKITNLTFDYLNLTKAIKSTDVFEESPGITRVNVYDVAFERALDYYTLQDITYIDANGKEAHCPKHIRIELQFWKNIGDVNAWVTYFTDKTRKFEENISLTGDIDFSKVDNSLFKSIYVSRFEGNGNTIKNLTIENISSSFGMFQKVDRQFTNVNFENINLSTSSGWSGGNYVTIIRYNFGEIDNLTFKNLNFTAPGTSYVAPIGYSRGISISNLMINNEPQKVDQTDENYKETQGDKAEIASYFEGVSYVGGLIGYSVENSGTNFRGNNVTVNATGSYIGGLVGKRESGSWSKLDGSNMTITGKSYVGGVIGSCTASSMNIINSYITALSGGEHIGGLAGYVWSSCNNLTAEHVVIHSGGSSYVGGLAGQSHGSYHRVHDVEIVIDSPSYYTYIGGLSGYGGTTYQYASKIRITCSHTNSDGSKTGGMNQVGGMYGFSYYNNYAYLEDAVIVNEAAIVDDKTKLPKEQYTGGFAGYGESYRFTIKNVTVTSNATNGGTGGFYGLAGNNYTISLCAGSQVSVTGVNNVGGFAGKATTGNIDNAQISASVVATGDYAGGAIGYIANTDDYQLSLSASVKRSVLQGVNVDSSGNHVGLFAGYSVGVLRDKFFTNNVLVGNITSNMGESPYYGIILPSSPTGVEDPFPVISEPPEKYPMDTYDNAYVLNPIAPYSNFYVYEDNTYNGNKAEQLRSFLPQTLNSIKMANLDDMKTDAFWSTTVALTSRSYVDQDGNKLTENGYYPLVDNDSKNAYTVTYPAWKEQEKILLPTKSSAYGINSRFMLGSLELPTLDVYSSGIDTVNMEFNDVAPDVTMTVYEDGKKVYSGRIESRVYTFGYDYQSQIKVLLTGGFRNQKEYTYEPDDLVHKVSTFDNSYAYIHDGQLKGNISSLKITPIHIYEDLVLADDLGIYDLSKGKITGYNTSTDMKVKSTVEPLFHFDLGVTKIDTFYNYSVIHKQDTDVVYEGQLFFQNGNLELVDKYLENDKSTVLVKTSGNKSYVTVLGNDGSLHDLKEEISLPNDFTNSGIEQMSNNIKNKGNMVVVMYTSGRVVVFDFFTGTQKEVEKATKNVSFIQYMKENLKFSNMFGTTSSIKADYESSKELKESLEKNPIIQDGNGDYLLGEKSSKGEDTEGKYQLASNYVSYYNAVRGDYEVVNLGSVVLGDEDEVITENNKIYTSNDLVEFYMKESVIDKASHNVSIVVLLGIVLFSVLVALGMAFKNEKDKEEII